MTKVKICGITRVPDAVTAIEEGADMIGFILSESPRRTGFDQLPGLLSAAAGRVNTVGVFAKPQDLIHFSESTQNCFDYYQVYFPYRALTVRQPKIGWIRASFIDSQASAVEANSSDLVLYDFKNVGLDVQSRLFAGRSGALSINGFLAGGLTVDNVADMVRRYSPYGVDVARGTESQPGIKDAFLIRRFIDEARHANG